MLVGAASAPPALRLFVCSKFNMKKLFQAKQEVALARRAAELGGVSPAGHLCSVGRRTAEGGLDAEWRAAPHSCPLRGQRQSSRLQRQPHPCGACEGGGPGGAPRVAGSGAAPGPSVLSDGHSSSSQSPISWPLPCRRMLTARPADLRLQREACAEPARLL